MAIAAIDAIVDLGNQYGYLKKRLDLRIAALPVHLEIVVGNSCTQMEWD